MERVPVKDLVEMMAVDSGLKVEQVRAVLNAQAAVVCDLAAKGMAVAVPGLGVVTMAERPDREMVLQFGPDKGKVVKIPPSRKLKFLFVKAAKDVILGGIPLTADVLEADPYASDTDDGTPPE